MYGLSVSLEQRLKALNQLMSVVKKCQSEDIWQKHFKMVLLLLLETMRDSSVSTVCCSGGAERIEQMLHVFFVPLENWLNVER